MTGPEKTDCKESRAQENRQQIKQILFLLMLPTYWLQSCAPHCQPLEPLIPDKSCPLARWHFPVAWQAGVRTWVI